MAVVSTISLIDKFSSPAKNISKNASLMRKSLDGTTSSVKKMQNTSTKINSKGLDTTTRKVNKLDSRVKKLRRRFKKLGKTKVKPKVELDDRASGKLGKLVSKFKKLAIAAAAIKIASVGSKAIWESGTALEGQQVSMTHFLGGDSKKSASFMKELRQNANKTPFETGEVVQAGTRAIQIAEGDTKSAMEMVRLAEDMAALNPTKTISDAMEALADAKMGEMERLKEFGFKGSKELFDKAGGNILAMKSVSGRSLTEMYAGGAEKLSETSKGLMSTATGTVKSGFADASIKILDRLKPAIKSLIPISKKVAKVLPAIADKAMDKLVPTVEFLADKAKVLYRIGKPVFVGLVEAIKPTIQTISEYAKPIIETTVSILEKLSPVFKGLGWIIKGIGKVFNFVLEPTLQAVSDLLSGFARIIEDTIEAVKRFTNWLTAPDDEATQKRVKEARLGTSGMVSQFLKGHATGSSFFGGGLTKINEFGEEMIELPRGSKIYPSGKTAQIIEKNIKNKGNNSNQVMNFTFNITTGGEIDEEKLGDIIYNRFSLAYQNC